jgi:biopolymer transport protein ExbD
MRRRLAPAIPAQNFAPIGGMNTTPLIDVMLVLLIMFIVTIPITTHKVAVDLPGDPRTPAVEPRTYRLDMDGGGRLFWDGAPVAEAQLPARFAAVKAEGNAAVLHFRTAGEARYEDFDRILAGIKAAGIERLGLDNGRFAKTRWD